MPRVRGRTADGGEALAESAAQRLFSSPGSPGAQRRPQHEHSTQARLAALLFICRRRAAWRAPAVSSVLSGGARVLGLYVCRGVTVTGVREGERCGGRAAHGGLFPGLRST